MWHSRRRLTEGMLYALSSYFVLWQLGMLLFEVGAVKSIFSWIQNPIHCQILPYNWTTFPVFGCSEDTYDLSRLCHDIGVCWNGIDIDNEFLKTNIFGDMPLVFLKDDPVEFEIGRAHV